MFRTATLSRPNPQNHDRAANIRGQIHDAQSNDPGTVAIYSHASVFMPPTDHTLAQLEFSPPGTTVPKDLDHDVKILPLSKGDHSPVSPSPDIEQQAHRRCENTPYYLGGEADSDSLSGSSEQ
jgi:hypothetical protein